MTVADTGVSKTFLNLDLQSLGDECATNHHHRQWHQLPNSKTSNSSSSGSIRAREEPKKKKNHLNIISKMMGANSSCPVVYV